MKDREDFVLMSEPQGSGKLEIMDLKVNFFGFLILCSQMASPTVLFDRKVKLS